MFYSEEDMMLKHRGTYEFLAPECFKQQAKGKQTTTTQYYSGRAADIWALGMTIYVLTFNQLPFQVGLGVDTHVAIQDLQLDFNSVQTGR